MDKNERIDRVKMALLGMQRSSWEQGVAAQAFLELGEMKLAVILAKESVVRQLADGRLGVIGSSTAVTDPGSNGEALQYACKVTDDINLRDALKKMLDWLLFKAPRNKDGILYHLDDKPQVWVDSFYMAPPLLSAEGYHNEAIKQINGYRKLLYDPQKKMFSHIWDDSHHDFIRKAFWGVGNGWALSGMTRVIGTLPTSMTNEKNMLIGYVVEALEGWLDLSYLKYAKKMQEAAYSKVDEYGFVQGVCASPNFDRHGTASEGQAFFLLMESASEKFHNSNK